MKNIPMIQQLITSYPHTIAVSTIGSNAYNCHDGASDLDVMFVFNDVEHPTEISSRFDWENQSVSLHSISLSAVNSILHNKEFGGIPLRSKYAECICLTLLFCDQRYVLYETLTWKQIRQNIDASLLSAVIRRMQHKCVTFAKLCKDCQLFCSNTDIYYHAIMLYVIKSFLRTSKVIISRSSAEASILKDIKRNKMPKHKAMTWYLSEIENEHF